MKAVRNQKGEITVIDILVILSILSFIAVMVVSRLMTSQKSSPSVAESVERGPAAQ